MFGLDTDDCIDTKVKDGRVTKSVDTPKAASKKTAEVAATKVGALDKKKGKKSKKEPTPEPSESESASESEGESSSASSDSEADTKTSKPKANGAKKGKPAVNGKAAKDESDSEGSEDESEGSSESSDSDDAGAKVAQPAKKAAAKAQPKKAGSSSSGSESESDSEDEKPQATAGEKDKPMNGASKEDSSDEEESSEGSEGSEGSESDDEIEAAADVAVSKKRKADAVEEPSAKKAKTVLPEGASKTLFVGNLSWNIDDEWLSRHFTEFGDLVRANVMTQRDTGRSKGFGFVEYHTVEEAVQAYNARKGSELDGRELNVDYTQPRGEGGNQNTDRKSSMNARAERFGDVKGKPSNTLFVGNVSFGTTADMLQEKFGEFGSITRIALPTDRETERPKGYGYVDMSSVEEAQAAMDALNGAEIDGRSLRLDFATPRDSNDGGRGGRGGGRGGRGGFDRGRGVRGCCGRGQGGGDGGGGGRGGRDTGGGLGDFSGTRVTF